MKTSRQMLPGVLLWIKKRWHGARPPNPEELKLDFFRDGTHLYVSARWATLAGLMPLYGDKFHQAVEMYLKGALLGKGFTLSRLARFRHNLWRLWKLFKKHYDDGTLSQFDKLIRQLDKFGAIRYPGKIRAMTMGISIGAGQRTNVRTKRPLPHYEVNLAEMDHLVRVIVEKMDVNPRGLFLGPKATDALRQDNPEAGFWV